jgi:hypothetical protein
VIDITQGIIDGMDSAALWVTEAESGIIEPHLVDEQKSRIVTHIETYLEHEATIGHANRAAWMDALDRARAL